MDLDSLVGALFAGRIRIERLFEFDALLDTSRLADLT